MLRSRAIKCRRKTVLVFVYTWAALFVPRVLALLATFSIVPRALDLSGGYGWAFSFFEIQAAAALIEQSIDKDSVWFVVVPLMVTSTVIALCNALLSDLLSDAQLP